MSKPGSGAASGPGTGAAGTPTPVASSPPPSESFFSEMDGTIAGSMLDTSFADVWDAPADAAALNIVSWKLDVNARIEDGVDKRGFNALSTVLAHPTKKANPLRGSRKPLPPLGQPAVLPKAPPPSFYDGYLKTIAPLYETFVQSQQAVAASSVPAASEVDQERKAANLPSLDSIPPVFFDTDFDIGNPSTWAAVMAAADADPAVGSKGRDAAVQDALSTHLDNLERHLVHEVTLRSSSFFSALANLQDLNSESSACLERINELKGALAEVGGKQARKGLEIIDAQDHLRTLRITQGGIRRIAELDDVLRLARGMADGADWAGALGCVEDVVQWWNANGEKASDGTSPHLPLTTLPALNNLPSSISALTANIAAQLETALGAVLLTKLGEGDSSEALDKEQFQGLVGPMVVALVRCGRLESLSGVWRASVVTAVREGLRQVSCVLCNNLQQHLPSNDDDEGAPSLAQSLQSMDNTQFLALCKTVYKSMLARLHRTQEMGESIAAVLATTGDAPLLAIGTSPAPPAKSEFDPADILSTACELANTRASKIISVRGEQHAALPIEQFLDVFNDSWAFVVATEALNKRMIVALRGVLVSQARGFLVSYHAQRLTRSAKLVEDETWVQVDVQPSTQHAINLVVQAAMSDPAECFIPPKTVNGDAVPMPTAPVKLISVEDKTFFVVKATAESLTLLSEYLPVVINLEVVVTDVISRIIEFLKSFNSRTCQVVLGAGAMRSAGLKNITAKHLALASQSLSVVVALIPYVREFLRRHLSAKQTVMLIEFDKLKRDYQEHQNEIHAKLVAIMADRLAVHCGELREIDWEAAPAKEGPNSYALMLVKETATLHKVLSKYLTPQTVDSVLSQVVDANAHRLSEEYGKVEFKSEEAKKRMLHDVAVIVTRLRPLCESGTSIAQLEALVREKATPATSPAPVPPAPAPAAPVRTPVAARLSRTANGSAETDGDASGSAHPCPPGTPNTTQLPPRGSSLAAQSSNAVPSPERVGSPTKAATSQPPSPSKPVPPAPVEKDLPPVADEEKPEKALPEPKPEPETEPGSVPEETAAKDNGKKDTAEAETEKDASTPESEPAVPEKDGPATSEADTATSDASKAEPESEAESKPEAETENKDESNPDDEVKTDSKDDDAKAESKDEVKADAKVEAEADAKPDAEIETEPESKATETEAPFNEDGENVDTEARPASPAPPPPPK